jgi:hypothetical protein
VESKPEAIAVLREVYLQFADKLTAPFSEKQLNIEDLPEVGRYTILIHIADVWE